MSTPTQPETSFEEAMERLDEIVELMEGERLALDDMVIRYEEGVRLLSLCRQRIETASLRVQRINSLMDGGDKVELEDFDLPAETAEEVAKAPAKEAPKRAPKNSAANTGDAGEIRLF